MCGIIGRDAHLHTVSHHNLDAVFFHTAGKASPDRHVVIALDFHDSAPKDLCYFSF